MALGEGVVEAAARTPRGYAVKVRLLAAIYAALNVVSLLVIGLIGWRVRRLVTLAQRSNVETLVLAIIVVLALYYLLSTFGGLVGGCRMLVLNLPALWGADRLAVERRKQRALRDGGEPLSVCFDQAVCSAEAPDAPLLWEVGDEAGKLGELHLNGVAAEFRPSKAGMNNSLFEFLHVQINRVLARRPDPSHLMIAFWGNIDESGAAVFRAAVKGLDTLARRTGGGPMWPAIALSAQEHRAVGETLRAVAPALRNEGLLPDLEYEVEYSVPILPEPLAFVQLKRTERRVDPVLTMGYALLFMCAILALTFLAVMYPPWVPSK
jgi:hypothetical protein